MRRLAPGADSVVRSGSGIWPSSMACVSFSAVAIVLIGWWLARAMEPSRAPRAPVVSKLPLRRSAKAIFADGALSGKNYAAHSIRPDKGGVGGSVFGIRKVRLVQALLNRPQLS
jgi:hypothetical protein